ncbi:MAG: hypothetical protein ACYTX0_59050, partial [Nostoc sp.]
GRLSTEVTLLFVEVELMETQREPQRRQQRARLETLLFVEVELMETPFENPWHQTLLSAWDASLCRSGINGNAAAFAPWR